MKNRRTNLILTVLAITTIIGGTVFFLLRISQEKVNEKIDLHSLVLPDSHGIIVLNKPAELCTMLKKQPQLESIFKEMISEDYYRIISRHKQAKAVISYYPKGTLLLYQKQYNTEKDFISEASYKFKKAGITYNYYPRSEKRYLGHFEYGNTYIFSYSKKLLEEVAEIGTKQSNNNNNNLRPIERFDESAILTISFYNNKCAKWQTWDIFRHEDQICCLQNYPRSEVADSLLVSFGDSLSQKITQQIPGISLHTDFSTDSSTVYYTFCTQLTTQAP